MGVQRPYWILTEDKETDSLGGPSGAADLDVDALGESDRVPFPHRLRHR